MTPPYRLRCNELRAAWAARHELRRSPRAHQCLSELVRRRKSSVGCPFCDRAPWNLCDHVSLWLGNDRRKSPALCVIAWTLTEAPAWHAPGLALHLEVRVRGPGLRLLNTDRG